VKARHVEVSPGFFKANLNGVRAWPECDETDYRGFVTRSRRGALVDTQRVSGRPYISADKSNEYLAGELVIRCARQKDRDSGLDALLVHAAHDHARGRPVRRTHDRLITTLWSNPEEPGNRLAGRWDRDARLNAAHKGTGGDSRDERRR
jgi:hypothetical protein